MATLASLVVELAANTAKFQTDMNRAAAAAQRSATQINNSLTSIQAGFTKAVGAARSLAGALGVGLGVGAFVALIRDSVRLGGELNTVSERVGVSIERLQELGYAATQTGASFEELEQGLGVLNQRIGEARAGNAEALRFFEKIGIQAQVLSGEIADAGGALGPFADKIKNTASAGDAMALAQEGMSRSGRALLPMLREGSEGLTRLAADARKAGIVMSEDMARGLSKANDQFDAMARVIRVQLAAAIFELKDPLLKLVGWVVDAAKAIRELVELASRIGGRFTQMVAPDEAANLAELNGRINQNATAIADLTDKRAALVESMKTTSPFGQQTARELIAKIDEEIAILHGRRHVLTALAAKAAVPTEMTLRRPGPPAGPAPISKEQTDAVAAFRQQLIDLAAQDPTVKALANIAEQADKLKEKFPRAKVEIDAIASALKNTTVSVEVTQRAQKKYEEGLKHTAEAAAAEAQTEEESAAIIAEAWRFYYEFVAKEEAQRVADAAAAAASQVESAQLIIDALEEQQTVAANLPRTPAQQIAEDARGAAASLKLFGDSFDFAGSQVARLRKEMQEAITAGAEPWQAAMVRMRGELTNWQTIDISTGLRKQMDAIGIQARVLGNSYDEVAAKIQATQRALAEMLALPETSQTQAAVASLKAELEELNAVALAQGGVRDIFGALNQAVNQSIAGVIQGTVTLKEAFANMGQSIALSLVQNVINRGIKVVEEAIVALIARLVSTGLAPGAATQAFNAPSMVGPSTFAEFYPSAEGAYVKHSPGGSLMRVGEGGKDEMIFPLDRVPVNPGHGGGDVNVVVNNNTDSQVGVREKQTPDGRQIEVMIDRVVTDGFSSGRYGGVMSSTYGLNRKGRVS